MPLGLFRKPKNDVITVVSGLPRSGTSLMMQMLKNGGLKVKYDDSRKADENNPKGYFELERVKTLEKNSQWLRKYRGKVIKIVSLYLHYLPIDMNYKIIFMNRNIHEILASQHKMLQRMHHDSDGLDEHKLKTEFEKHLREIKLWLTQQQHLAVLYINYNDLVQNPTENANTIINFLERDLSISKMVQAVDKSLYRNRL